MNGVTRLASERGHLIIGTVLTIYLLAGCAGDSSPTQALPSSGTTPAPNATQSASQIKVTLTLPLVATPAPTEAAGSPAPSVMPTSTALPPLKTGEEALAFVIEMQETNGGCDLPCWWGITLGNTIGQEARQILSPVREFGENYVLDVTTPVIQVYTFDLKEYSNISVRLETKKNENQPVDNIKVGSFISINDDATHYHDSWRRYFVAELLARLGQPSEVWLGFGPYGPQGSKRYLYELMVFYEDPGLTVEYAGLAVKGDPNHACLALEQLKLLRLNIQRPSDPNLVKPPGPGEPFTDLRPLSEVTDLSLEGFYETFKDPNNQTCLESPANLWP